MPTLSPGSGRLLVHFGVLNFFEERSILVVNQYHMVLRAIIHSAHENCQGPSSNSIHLFITPTDPSYAMFSV